jgi:hypothetical protein
VKEGKEGEGEIKEQERREERERVAMNKQTAAEENLSTESKGKLFH